MSRKITADQQTILRAARDAKKVVAKYLAAKHEVLSYSIDLAKTFETMLCVTMVIDKAVTEQVEVPTQMKGVRVSYSVTRASRPKAHTQP